jgi:hypothetical protein
VHLAFHILRCISDARYSIEVSWALALLGKSCLMMKALYVVIKLSTHLGSLHWSFLMACCTIVGMLCLKAEIKDTSIHSALWLVLGIRASYSKYPPA